MKIRQTYFCKDDVVCIQFTYNNQGLVVELRDIETKLPVEVGEYILPKVEVTDEFFMKIINNKRLK